MKQRYECMWAYAASWSEEDWVQEYLINTPWLLYPLMFQQVVWC